MPPPSSAVGKVQAAAQDAATSSSSCSAAAFSDQLLVPRAAGCFKLYVWGNHHVCSSLMEPQHEELEALDLDDWEEYLRSQWSRKFVQYYWCRPLSLLNKENVDEDGNRIIMPPSALERLEELGSAVAELEESNCKLAVLKVQGDTTHGTPILFPALGNKNTSGNNVRDKQKELHDLEAYHKEFTDLSSQRLVEIRRLHEERIETLNKLATLQNTLTDFTSISSSKAFQVLNDQLQKSQAELDHCQTLLEKLQVNKDKIIWQERETNVKVDLAGIPHRVSMNCESSIAALEQNLQKVADEKNMLVLKLEESSREPGRDQIISEFKTLVSSLPREMGAMQSDLSKYKDDASELHSLRAEVHSLSDILARKEHAVNESLCKSAHAGSEIRDLQSRVCELRQTNCELKLFVEMYKRESTDSRDVQEFEDREYYEWAHVQSLKSSLDQIWKYMNMFEQPLVLHNLMFKCYCRSLWKVLK